MKEVTFRSISPVFRFELEDSEGEFSHSGKYKDARYSISLKRYQGSAGFQELMKYSDEGSRRQVSDISVLGNWIPYGVTDYFLVVDVAQPSSDELETGPLSEDSGHITERILGSLRLHSSHGLLYYPTYQFRSPPYPGVPLGLVRSWPLTPQYPFSHLGFPSVLPDSEFARCRSTFDALVEREWSDSVTFDMVLRLALAYHKTAFNLEAVEHAFLILMVAFEALFKKESESNASQAAGRISKSVSTVQRGKKAIQREFFDNDPNCFCRIRNSIAHGNPGLDLGTVKSKYPTLYRHVTDAMITLVSIPPGKIDHTQDYYEEVSKFVDSWYSALPAS